MRRVVHSLGADAVHLNSMTLIPYASLFSPVPVFVHVREWAIDGLAGLRKKLLQLICRGYATGMIYICRDYQRHFPVPATPELTILNPVSLHRRPQNAVAATVEARVRAWRESAPDVPIALFLGGLSYIKGSSFVARAWAKLDASDCRLIVAGQFEAPQRGWALRFAAKIASQYPFTRTSAYARRLWQKYQDTEGVCFAGFVSSPMELMRRVDVVIVPFTEPHFARPVIEAAAVGCRTLVSEIGGLLCLLEDHIATYGFDGENDEAFRSAMAKFRVEWSRAPRPLDPVSPRGVEPTENASVILGFMQGTISSRAETA